MPRRGKNLSHCRACGAPIRWAKTRSGRRMAVSDSSDPNGTVLFDGDTAVVLGAQEAALEQERGSLLFVAHASTCPASQPHRPASRMPDNVRQFLRDREVARRGHGR